MTRGIAWGVWLKHPVRTGTWGKGQEVREKRCSLELTEVPCDCHGLWSCIRGSAHWEHWLAWSVFLRLSTKEAWVYGWPSSSICGWAGQVSGDKWWLGDINEKNKLTVQANYPAQHPSLGPFLKWRSIWELGDVRTRGLFDLLVLHPLTGFGPQCHD